MSVLFDMCLIENSFCKNAMQKIGFLEIQFFNKKATQKIKTLYRKKQKTIKYYPP